MPLVAVVFLMLGSLLQVGVSPDALPAVSADAASVRSVVASPSAQAVSLRVPAPVSPESVSRQGAPPLDVRWVAPHRETVLWSVPTSGAAPDAERLGLLHQWVPLQVVGAADRGRTPVWDPSSRRRG